jgi:hypothetical protein
MQYYPHWLDYFELALGAGGALCFLAMQPQPEGPKRGWLKLAACASIGLAVSLAGICGALFNARAMHYEEQGQIFNVVRHGGRSASTKFSLRSGDGQVAGLSFSSDVPQIVDGELADVVFQADSYVVLHVTIVQGDYGGFEKSASDGIFGSWISILGGLALMAYGILNWVSDGTGIVVESEANQLPPDGDVDQSSLLHQGSDR